MNSSDFAQRVGFGVENDLTQIERVIRVKSR